MSHDEREDGEALLYCGIDEAGYGPVLGPLCVASTMFEVRDAVLEEGTAPDLWKSLRRGVSRSVGKSARGRRLPIADSKQLKLPNPKADGTGGRDPLLHLERGVLAMLHVRGTRVETVDELLAALGAERSELPWYASSASTDALPRGTTGEHIRMLGAHLAGVMERAGVSVRSMRCACIDESRFNAQLREVGVKSAVSFGAVAKLLSEAWRWAQKEPGRCPRVVIDRQGGRTNYAEALSAAVPEAEIEVLGESAGRSAYALSATSAGQRVRMRVFFEVEAERRHLPVALASMTAKLVRELMMARFNAHFGERMVELKATAGYHTDGMRWLRDADGILSPEEKVVLRRQA